MQVETQLLVWDISIRSLINNEANIYKQCQSFTNFNITSMLKFVKSCNLSLNCRKLKVCCSLKLGDSSYIFTPLTKNLKVNTK